MSTVFVVGSLNIDQTIRVRSLPGPGETVRGSDAVYGPGGKGGNQAVAAARAGAAVAFTGAVGDDAHGHRILEFLSDAGVDCRHTRIVDAVPTGTAVIAVDDEGQNQILVSPGANSSLTTEDMDIPEGREGDILVLQLEIPAPLVRHAARRAKSRGLYVVMNAAPAPHEIENLFDDVDLLIVNEQEISLLAETAGVRATDHRDLVRSLPPVLGPAIVFTAGAEGSFAVVDGDLVHVPAHAVIAEDTTGAGDTFVGYLAASLLADRGDLVAAMELATRASALTVARSGAMESIPHRGEVLQAFDSPSPLPPQGCP
ncbi:ribokinase [Rhodococcus sp. NPDC049939]|uniref:ribokinase n=1 Tax=Rhodococcus sp. NPDC049939 TaxID=3155511 RepID=UPI0033C01816